MEKIRKIINEKTHACKIKKGITYTYVVSCYSVADVEMGKICKKCENYFRKSQKIYEKLEAKRKLQIQKELKLWNKELNKIKKEEERGDYSFFTNLINGIRRVESSSNYFKFKK
ncbi:hypothetical protein ACFX5K_01260 [Rickettsiales bacterium LUAb2]